MDEQFAVTLVEKDVHADFLNVWNYPQVSQPLQSLVEKIVSSSSATGFQYTKVKSDWIYIMTVPCSHNDVVRAASLGLVTSSFNPEKWQAVLGALCQQYCDNKGVPVKILEGMLAFITQGKFADVTLSDPKFATEKSFLAVSAIDVLWRELGFDCVILYNAMLLKKRILIIGDNVNNLLMVMRSMPQFVSHRRNWSILRPLVVDGSAVQADDLQESGVFVAGTLDASLTSHKQICYDVVVSLVDKRVTISQDSVPDLKMCSFHKDMANAITEMTNNPGNAKADTTDSNEIIVKMSEFTSKALKQIQSLGAQGIADISNASTREWLHRVATAEGLLV